MTALTLFQTLRGIGVELTPYPDGTLGYKAPKGILTPQLLDAMRAHKPMLLGLVETFSERAAMLEYNAGLAREDAEWLAWQELGGEPTPSH